MSQFSLPWVSLLMTRDWPWRRDDASVPSLCLFGSYGFVEIERAPPQR